MSFEIIDFNTHPFIDSVNNICDYKEFMEMNASKTKQDYEKMGISAICGSVVEKTTPNGENEWDKCRRNNRTAIELKDLYGDFYIPGFHIHPDFIDESISEMKLMHSFGINLIGELNPKFYGYNSYTSEAFKTLMNEASGLGMVVSLSNIGHDDLDTFSNLCKDVICVVGQPGEAGSVQRHIERMMKNENFYLDLSGGRGAFRHGMLRHTIDSVGSDRILFASGYPWANPAIAIGAVMLDPELTDNEKEKILSLNAKRILGI